MYGVRLSRQVLIMVALFALAACGDGSNQQGLLSNAGDDTNSTAGAGTDETTTVSLQFLGSGGTDTSFTVGTLDIAVDGDLSAGGSTSISATIADSLGQLYPNTAVVTFSSGCTGSSQATINSPIITSSGTLTTTYTAAGCRGTDPITAKAFYCEDGTAPDQESLRCSDTTFDTAATGSITIAAPTQGNIIFIGADPEEIGIKGTGINEVSTVTFKVVDENGDPIQDQEVEFQLSTTIGGVALTSSSAVSNGDGLVRVNVNSGTVPTPIDVIATFTNSVGATISSSSRGLTIDTSRPDQDSFSLSLSDHSPEAYNYDGVKVVASIYAADHANNPVADGTPIYFTTEGGQIEPQCTTVNGSCTATWKSSNPRPEDGRITILATAIGEESFTDIDANGLLDDNEPFIDMGEPFLDKNENLGADESVPSDPLRTLSWHLGRDVNEEFKEFVDSTKSRDFINHTKGVWDDPDGYYNGVLCNPINKSATRQCNEQRAIYIRGRQLLVMSGSNLNIQFYTKSGVNYTEVSPSNMVNLAETSTVYVAVFDDRRQRPPSGTKISFSAADLEISPIMNDKTVADGTGPYDPAKHGNFNVELTDNERIASSLVYTVSLKAPDNPDTNRGTLVVAAETPRDVVSENSISVSY